jgi:hypothetical protein
VRKSLTSYQCDVCKWPEKTLTTAQANDQGWLSISIESYHEDRSWSDRDVCPSCAEKIYRAFTKTMMPSAKDPK